MSNKGKYNSNVMKITKPLVVKVIVVPYLVIEIGRAGIGMKIINRREDL